MKRLTRAAAAACVLSLSSVAAAEPTFPAAVDDYIMFSGRVEAMFGSSSPPGCDLCHLNGSTGGLPLTEFGTALHISSSSPNSDELNAALVALDASNPRAIEDLKMLVDPNTDSSAFDGEASPHYGCGSIASGEIATAPVWCGLIVAALVWGRRRVRERA